MSIGGAGLCECGCGKRTRLAPQSAIEKGWVNGQPLRFIRGHNLRTTGEDHLNWKGDEVGDRALHKWVARNREKTGKCSTCLFVGKTEWANISGVYLRDIDDFAEMCRLCHREFDGWLDEQLH